MPTAANTELSGQGDAGDTENNGYTVCGKTVRIEFRPETVILSLALPSTQRTTN